MHSILDNDLYKFTMHWAVHQCYPNTPAEYIFINRNKNMKFSGKAYQELVKRIDNLKNLQISREEEDFLSERCPFFPGVYVGYLRQFRYKPEYVKTFLTGDGDLELSIVGPWDQTILFEVPLLSLISEVYFEFCDNDWNMEGQLDQAHNKAYKLSVAGVKWADFGTRRRRNFETQDIVVREMQQCDGFIGTSNVHLAHKYGVRPVGTMAHEWIMGTSAMCGLRHANRYALRSWSDVYGADLGIALTDTFGTSSFFEDFDMLLAKTFDGVRHDSGDPLVFADRVVEHYKKLRIDPTTKAIVFSDGLSVNKAIEIARHCHGRIRYSFGIGTHLTNDFGESKAMNIVIKLRSCDGIQVVKLSDEPGKATGDEDALRVAKWTFINKKLDEA